jgi:hypothetical protein
MRGEIVYVRDAWGNLLVRRVWDVTPERVFICNEERFHRLMKDPKSDWLPIGFPRENVFYYDPAGTDNLRPYQITTKPG